MRTTASRRGRGSTATSMAPSPSHFATRTPRQPARSRTTARNVDSAATAAPANLAAADFRDLPHRVYNVGTGTEVSIRELLRATATAAGADPDAVVAVPAPRRPGEVHRSCRRRRPAQTDVDGPVAQALVELVGQQRDDLHGGPVRRSPGEHLGDLDLGDGRGVSDAQQLRLAAASSGTASA